jgi:hypothetical protein
MPRRQAPNVLFGMLRLARFDAGGMAEFVATREAFLASLAPLVAFALVGAALMLLHGGGLDALTEFLATLCALLAPPVLSHFLAIVWRRQDDWPRYAAAFNWCQWVILMAFAAALLSAGAMVWAGLPNHVAAAIALGALLIYALVLHWFIARTGLRLSGLRAALLVLGVNLGTGLLMLLPVLLTLTPKEG